MTVEDPWTETWTVNWFAALLADAVSFDQQAQAAAPVDFPTVNRFARAAITSAVLAVEAAANSCMARMEYPAIVVKQLDKLSTIDKYDALYASRFAKNIDRGSAPFQVVAELFGFRNRYVHPKLAKIAVRISIDDKGSKRYEKDAEQQKKATHLGIPFDFATWTGEHSRVAVKETILFFNHFFSDLCGLDKQECTALLSLFAKGAAGTANLLAVHETTILRGAEQTYGVEIKFLSL
ncbi:MAG: hypothetical protein WDO72_02315 [Pseudomonadota bacterium]